MGAARQQQPRLHTSINVVLQASSCTNVTEVLREVRAVPPHSQQHKSLNGRNNKAGTFHSTLLLSGPVQVSAISRSKVGVLPNQLVV